MFDTTQALAADLMAPIRGRRKEAIETRDAGDVGSRHLAAATYVDDLDKVRAYVTAQLPWISKTAGEPVGMWVESVGRVDNRFEPFPIGTAFAWVAVASWDAAEAVYEALAPIAGIDDARWVGGWHDSESGLRKIKIYPQLHES